MKGFLAETQSLPNPQRSLPMAPKEPVQFDNNFFAGQKRHGTNVTVERVFDECEPTEIATGDDHSILAGCQWTWG